MPTETVKYACSSCNEISLYKELVMKKTATINMIEIHYQYLCPICHSKKFRIISVDIKS